MSAPKLLFQGISAAALIVAVDDLPLPKFVKTLGDASYGVYLLHFPIIILTINLFPNTVLWRLLAVTLIVGTAFGMFDHWLYRRLIRLT